MLFAYFIDIYSSYKYLMMFDELVFSS